MGNGEDNNVMRKDSIIGSEIAAAHAIEWWIVTGQLFDSAFAPGML